MTEANLINVDVTQGFLRCPEEAEHCVMLARDTCPVPPAAISEDSKEKRLTSAAKAQALGFFSLRAPSMPYIVRHFHEKSLGVGPAPAIALDATDQPLTIIANLD